MKYILKTCHLNTPDKVLLADLRKTAKKLGKNHISFNEYETEGVYNPGTLCSRFGGWNEALAKAGLKVKKIWRISDDELLGNMKNVWDSLGRQPLWDEMECSISLYCPTTYARRFGSWRRALQEFVKSVSKGKYKPEKEQFLSTKTGVKKRILKKINSHVNKSMRFDVLRRDNYKCRLCGASPAMDSKITLHVDHIIPASKGGENILKNLQTLCSDCNYGKAAKTDH